MTDLYLDIDKRIKKGELLPNFRSYCETILADKNLRNLFIYYCKRKREYPDLPFIPQEEVLLAIRNQALYGIFDPEYMKEVGKRKSLLLLTGEETILLKNHPYKISPQILAFLSDLVMEWVDFVKINDAAADYYEINKDEITSIKDWALKLSLLFIEPSVAFAYNYPAYILAFVDNYKMNILTCVYAKRHRGKVNWEGLSGCDFTLPKFQDEKDFTVVFREFIQNVDLNSRDIEKFVNAFEKEWKHLEKFSDEQFGFKIVPKLNYKHFKRFLRLAGKKGVAIDKKTKYKLINYLSFISKVNPSLGMTQAYEKMVIEAFLSTADSKARKIAQITEKKDSKRQGRVRRWLKNILKDVVERAIAEYDPLFLWKRDKEKSEHFFSGDIQDTINRKKFKIIPIANFVEKKIMLKLKELREEGSIRDFSGEISLGENSDGGEKVNRHSVKLSEKNSSGTAVSKGELFRDKLLVIEDFADLILMKVSDKRLDDILKINLIKRLRYWDERGYLKPKERSRRRKTRFYHRDQISKVSEALDKAEMGLRHEVKGFYNLAQAKEKLGFNKCINTFRNRVANLVVTGKLPKDVKNKFGYIFTEDQLNIIKKNLL